MATPAQTHANRANALRSTGPRSEAGRQITRFNALKHGLAAKELVIPGEDPAALDALRADLIAEHQPAGPTEALLVEELAVCWWRLQRARKEEASMVRGVVAASRFYDSPLIGGALRYTIAAERAWNRALANLGAARKDCRQLEPADTQPAPGPQPVEAEKVMAIGSVLQSGPEPAGSEPTPTPEPPSEVAIHGRQLTTNIGFVPQNEPQTAQPIQATSQRHEVMVRQAGIDGIASFIKSDLARMQRERKNG